MSEKLAVGRPSVGLSNGQRCHSSDALVEWRSSGQVENGTPSTSPPYWDTDCSDVDGGLNPSDLYGRHTWRIENFSQINKRELRSSAFEIGGYKWYILIYPQGCDVCNHLSLFLCVANHDKLLPGWSHFAQFTIFVVNKDLKKSKQSDTLHCFWKKEHDWGWKKFMELSKVSDGFVDADTLTIQAQVQVIREKADRPFRCLDGRYRSDLIRNYSINVEQICRRFIEERRGKLGKLLEDKVRWSSFCAFWLGMDKNARCRMSREKKGTIIKVVIKHFFIEKEVTSTLVMESLYSGLKALEGPSKVKGKLVEGELTLTPIVQVKNDMFVLVDDIILLLERAAVEPLPPKDDKGPQNRTKDGVSRDDFNKDSIERALRRLTELGRRTVEIFALAHIFSTKIEIAYQEAVAFKRQEELIHEEEAAWLVESEQRAKRRSEKDKKSKKKQSKQRRNNRKVSKVKDKKPVIIIHDKQLHEAVEAKNLGESQIMPEKDGSVGDASNLSDSLDGAVDMLQHDSKDKDVSPVNWDTDSLEIQTAADRSFSETSSMSMVQNGGLVDKRSSFVMDDSSSTCSTDSAPSVVNNGYYKSIPLANCKNQWSPARGKSQRGKKEINEDYGGVNEAESRPFVAASAGIQNGLSHSRKAIEPNNSEGAVTSLQDRTKWPELNAVKKEDGPTLLQRKVNSKDHVDVRTSKEKMTITQSLSKSTYSYSIPASAVQPKSDRKSNAHAYLVPVTGKTSMNEQQHTEKGNSQGNVLPTAIESSSPDTLKTSPKQAADLSRPSSARLIPETLAAASTAISMVQTSTTLLSHSVNAVGRLGTEHTSAGHPYIPQSYRNAIVGNSSVNASTTGFMPASPGGSTTMFSQQPSLVPSPVYLPQIGERMELETNCATATGTSLEPVLGGQSSLVNEMPSSNCYQSMMNNGSPDFSFTSAGTCGRQVQSAGLADEFPHLDIINDLLDDEQGLGRVPHRSVDVQFTYPTDVCPSSEVGLSLSSCRFQQPRSYPENGFPQDYVSSTRYNSIGDVITQCKSVPYMNGLVDCMVPNQWQLLGPYCSLPDLRNLGMNGYSFNVSDYSNMVACGVNGYTMFQPSNGH